MKRTELITKRIGAFAALALILGVCLTVPVAASAALPPFFAQFPEEPSTAGSGAGQLNNAVGIDSDPATGHVFASDINNNRISEYTAWGEFVKAWGWGVLDGSAELQVCTTATGCQQGIAGSGNGQFGALSLLGGIAVDGNGDVYVVDKENARVQKFDSEGNFLLMLGSKVNKTKEEAAAPEAEQNRCPVDPGDVCQAGLEGNGPGAFKWAFPAGDWIDTGPDGTLYVGDFDRVQEFNPDGTYESELSPLPEARPVQALAIDPSSGITYISLNHASSFSKEAPFIYKHAGGEWKKFASVAVAKPQPEPFSNYARGLAVDSAGSVYAFVRQTTSIEGTWQELVQFDSSGTCLICPGEHVLEPEKGIGLEAIGTSSDCGVSPDTLYLAQFGSGKSFIRAYGTTPDAEECPPPLLPPAITEQYAVAADTDGAVVRAKINPRFWADTRYYVEYGTGKCSEGGCQTQPAPPGALLVSKPIGAAVNTAGVFLTGLEPGTTYHYRFVAESSGGGPVIGGERTLHTFPLASESQTDCPNQAFRVGSSAPLPDCRAFEMVSPVEKEGGDIIVLNQLDNLFAHHNQSSVDGGRFTYSSYRAFGETTTAPYTSQYMASRGEEGWASEPISPPREGLSLPTGHLGLDVQYKLFSEDLCEGWLLQDAEPVLHPAAPPGFSDLYRRDLCGSGGYEPLSTATPNANPQLFLPELQGVSADGSTAVLRVGDRLTEDASSAEVEGAPIQQLYLSTEGVLRLVSLLPNGTASNLDSSAGSVGRNPNHDNSVWRALSDDGSRVFWTAGGTFGAPGTIYVRDNADQEQSAIEGGQCTEEEKACTYPVSGPSSQFWGANPDGSRALYTSADKLFEYDFESRTSALIAKGVQGLAGYSEDLLRVYLASTEVLSGEEENSEGAKAIAGKPNLYLYERGEEAGEGEFSFVGTLASGDLGKGASPISILPSNHTARVSPDGGIVAFTSSASLTGYDNTDLASGQADAEVFLYEAGAKDLACVSCNPSGARPTGRDIEGEDTFPGGATFWAASYIDPWPTQLYPSRVLSADGSRLFFESFDALVLRDTNGKRDVYEWRSADSAEECEEAGAELFAEQANGCLSLISSGQSPSDSHLVDAGADGSDVFIATAASLLPHDPGLIDVYDARVNGGFPPPPTPPAACEGEACQSLPAPPDDPTPASSAFEGAGNVVAGKPSSCRKGKVRRRGRCVKKPRKQKRPGKANRKGRAGR